MDNQLVIAVITERIGMWLLAWLEMIETMIYICTFTLYLPLWSISVMMWLDKR